MGTNSLTFGLVDAIWLGTGGEVWSMGTCTCSTTTVSVPACWERVEKYGQWERQLKEREHTKRTAVGNGWRSMVNGNYQQQSVPWIEPAVGNGWRSMVNGNFRYVGTMFRS